MSTKIVTGAQRALLKAAQGAGNVGDDVAKLTAKAKSAQTPSAAALFDDAAKVADDGAAVLDDAAALEAKLAKEAQAWAAARQAESAPAPLVDGISMGVRDLRLNPGLATRGVAADKALPDGAHQWVRLGDLKPIHSRQTVGDRPDLRGLTDNELLAAMSKPAKGDLVQVNTRTGGVVDGNSRIHELLRRAGEPRGRIDLDTPIPVRRYTPTTFWDD